MPILEVQQLTKAFGGVEALSQVDLVVEPGEVIGVIGPNGAGKSTFFNVLSGVMKPSGGKVVFQGQDITGLKPHRIAKRVWCARSRAPSCSPTSACSTTSASPVTSRRA